MNNPAGQEEKTPFTLEFAQREDIPQILRLIRELAAYEGMEEQVVATETLLAQWLFEKKTAEVLMARWEGETIGFALFFHNFSTFLGRGGLYLEDLYIVPAWRGKGFGRKVLQRLAEIALQRGCGRLEWWCLDWNRPSIGFYRSLGAEAMEDWTVYRLCGEALTALAQGKPSH